MKKYLSHNGNLIQRGENKLIYRNYTPGTVLPPYTLRLKFKDGITPTFSYGTGTLFDATNNIWDLTYNNSNWIALLMNQSDLLEVIDGNTTGVTNMNSMFSDCNSLTTLSWFDTSSVTNMYFMFARCSSLVSVPLLSTSSVTNMQSMFISCISLTSVPLFNTPSVTNMSYMFFGCSSLTTVTLLNTSKVTSMNSMFSDCINVQSGALALYQQASAQTTPPTSHVDTFSNCGTNTSTGRAELDQIPSDWGGTM